MIYVKLLTFLNLLWKLSFHTFLLKPLGEINNYLILLPNETTYGGYMQVLLMFKWAKRLVCECRFVQYKGICYCFLPTGGIWCIADVLSAKAQFISYTPNTTGEKHTISALVDQTPRGPTHKFWWRGVGEAWQRFIFYTQKNHNFRICLPKKIITFFSIPKKIP